MTVLVTAASEHGSTWEIAEAIGNSLRQRGLEVDLIAPEQVHDVDAYDAVVLGSAVYAGHWCKPAMRLVQAHADALSRRPVWLFSSGPVGDPRRKLVQKMGVDPVDLPELREATHARDHRMFAGRLDKRNLKGLQRAALTVFRGLQGDFRDWSQIETWAGEIADCIHGNRSSLAEVMTDGDGT